MERSQYLHPLNWPVAGRSALNALARVRHPALLLTLVALLSSALYAVYFTGRVSLIELYTQPRLDGTYPYWGAPAFRWHFITGFSVQFFLYWLGWRFSLVARGWLAWLVVLCAAAASALALLFIYPFEAADIFDNIMHGRILGVYGDNPFITTAAQYRQDPFYPYMAWKRSPSAYGPIWEFLAGGTARLAGDHILTNILAFKLLPGIFLAASILVLALLLRRFARQRALAGVLLLAWNPLVLYETLGNGHNDIAMIFWVLLAVWALAEQRHTLAVLALVAGALVKFIPILLLPVAIIIALRRYPRLAQKLRWLAFTLAAATALIWLAYAPFWRGLTTLSLTRRSQLFSASLPAALYNAFKGTSSDEQIALFISAAAAILTACFVIWRSTRQYKSASWLNFPGAAFSILMFYLLITCLWFQQWYAVWPLALAAVLPQGHQSRLGVLFSFVVLNKQFIIGPYLFRQRPPIPQPWLEILFSAGLLLLPWSYAGFIFLYNWIRAHLDTIRRRKRLSLIDQIDQPHAPS